LFASASAAVYDRFGINDGDIANYRHMAAGIRSCALASSLVPDYLHPPANRAPSRTTLRFMEIVAQNSSIGTRRWASCESPI
jgi:hypothetical protein